MGAVPHRRAASSAPAGCPAMTPIRRAPRLRSRRARAAAGRPCRARRAGRRAGVQRSRPPVAVEPAAVDQFVRTSSDDRALQASVEVAGERRIRKPSERRFLPRVQVTRRSSPATPSIPEGRPVPTRHTTGSGRVAAESGRAGWMADAVAPPKISRHGRAGWRGWVAVDRGLRQSGRPPGSSRASAGTRFTRFPTEMTASNSCRALRVCSRYSGTGYPQAGRWTSYLAGGVAI
jgi:hypothetical protein